MAITKRKAESKYGPMHWPLWLRRSLWLLAIWVASVAVMGVLALLMRGVMQLIGLGR